MSPAFRTQLDSFNLTFYLSHTGMNIWIWFFCTRSLTTTLDKSDLPLIAKSGFTRNNANNLIKFVIPYAKTVTYQSSYFIRSCSDLRNRDIGLYSFKSGLKSYYKHALSNTFDVDDPRTWKSVCIKCRRARSLNEVINCC